MFLLVYSSLLFSIVYKYGEYIGHWFGPAFLGMTILSVLNHTSQNVYIFTKIPTITYIIYNVDMWYAHILVLGTAIECYNSVWHPILCIYWICLSWMFYVFWVCKKSYVPHSGDYWHSTIHIAGTIGACSILYAKSLINIKCTS